MYSSAPLLHLTHACIAQCRLWSCLYFANSAFCLHPISMTIKPRVPLQTYPGAWVSDELLFIFHSGMSVRAAVYVRVSSMSPSFSTFLGKTLLALWHGGCHKRARSISAVAVCHRCRCAHWCVSVFCSYFIWISAFACGRLYVQQHFVMSSTDLWNVDFQ